MWVLIERGSTEIVLFISELKGKIYSFDEISLLGIVPDDTE